MASETPGYASNTPISRPAHVPNWKIFGDFNGVLWNNLFGFFYAPVDEQMPIREPSSWMLSKVNQ
jgi:hypothetical protein